MGIEWVKILVFQTSPSVFDLFLWNSVYMYRFPLGYRCVRHIFRKCKKICCHGNHTFSKNLRKRSMWARSVNVQCAFLDSGSKCVAMVTAYYVKLVRKCVLQDGVLLITFDDIFELFNFFGNSHSIPSLTRSKVLYWLTFLCALKQLHF